MDMTEFNFIYLGKEIMAMSFERHLCTSLSLLKLNSVVSRKVAEPFERQSDIQTNTGDNSQSVQMGGNHTCVQKGKSSRKRAKSVPAKLKQDCSTDMSGFDIGKDIATQTAESSFVRDHMKDTIQYLVNTIRLEDFDSEYD